MQQVTYGLDSAVLSKRSQHDNISIETVRNGSKDIAVRLRVAGDAKIRNSLRADQERAYDNISHAFSMITAGLGLYGTDYSTQRGKSLLNGVGSGAEIMMKYWQWRDLCRSAHVSSRMAIDIIVFGKTLKQCDRDHKKGTGTAIKNLLKCLDLWEHIVVAERPIPAEAFGFFEKMKIKWNIKI